MELVVPKPVPKPRLTRGQPYMAWVKVFPYYEEGNPQPIMLRFNEISPRKPKEQKPQETEELHSVVGGEVLM